MTRSLLYVLLSSVLAAPVSGGVGAVSLAWGAVRPTECSAAGSCSGGACGFRDCDTAVSCRGGRCVFINSASPSCEGGGCKFIDCASPTCRGGGCDFVRTTTVLLDGFCAGGACTIEGFPARHKTAGSATY